MLGLVSIGFTFDGGDTALIDLELADRRESRPVGLDGTYRISRQSPDKEPVALRGEWLPESEFAFSFNDFTQAQNILGRAAFSGDGITLWLRDPYNDLDIAIKGNGAQRP
jgi:hypothetical protein